jgi:Domain of unknown function (DUF4349)
MMRILSAIALAVLLAGCAGKKTAAPGAGAVSGESNGAASMLAYSHNVKIELPSDAIAPRIDALHSACRDARFGACSILTIEQRDGEYASGEMGMRIAPAGVEPMVKLAAKSSTIASRTLSAEDLAQAVADTALQTDTLTRQREKFIELLARKDLSVSDSITLAREISVLDANLAAAARDAAQQQRRLETNVLNLSFRPPHHPPGFGARIKTMFSDIDDQALQVLEFVIELLTHLLPLAIVLFPLALLWRAMWRRFTRV